MALFIKISIFLILLETTIAFMDGSLILDGAIEEDVGRYIAFEGQQAVVICEYTWSKINISVIEFSANYNGATSDLFKNSDASSSFSDVIKRNFTLNITKSLSGNISCSMHSKITDSTFKNSNVTFKSKTISFLKVLSRSEFNGCRSNLGSEIIEGETVTQCCSLRDSDNCLPMGNNRAGLNCQTYNVTTLNQIVSNCSDKEDVYFPFSPLTVHEQVSLEINPREVFVDLDQYHSEGTIKNISFSCETNPPSKNVIWQVFAYVHKKNKFLSIFSGRISSAQVHVGAAFHTSNQPGLSTLDTTTLNWQCNDNGGSKHKCKPTYVSCHTGANGRGPVKRFAYFNYRRSPVKDIYRLKSDNISKSTPESSIKSPEQSTHSALYLNIIFALSALSVLLLFTCVYLFFGKFRGVKKATKEVGSNESTMQQEREPGDGDNSPGLSLSVRNVPVRNAPGIEYENVTCVIAEQSAIVESEPQIYNNDDDAGIHINTDRVDKCPPLIVNQSQSHSNCLKLRNSNASMKNTGLNREVITNSCRDALKSDSSLDLESTDQGRPERPGKDAVVVRNEVYESSDHNIFQTEDGIRRVDSKDSKILKTQQPFEENDEVSVTTMNIRSYGEGINALSDLDHQSYVPLKKSHIIKATNRNDSVKEAVKEGVSSCDDGALGLESHLDNTGEEHEKTKYSETVMVRNEVYESCDIAAPLSTDNCGTET